MKRFIKSDDQLDMCSVIKTKDTYDPEGLNIRDKGKEVFSGSFDECMDWLTSKYADCEKRDTCIVENYVPGQELKVYYPYAISNEYFTIVDK